MSPISRLGEDVSLVGTNPSVRVSSAHVSSYHGSHDQISVSFELVDT